MAKQKLIDKKYEVQNGAVVILETVEKQLSPEELVGEKQQYLQRQQQIIQQMNSLKVQYDQLDEAILEVDEMLASFPDAELLIAAKMPNVPKMR